MNIHRLWNKGLPKDMHFKLEKRYYSEAKIEGVYRILLNTYHLRMKVFKRITVLLVIMFIFMLFGNWSYIEDKFLAVLSRVLPMLISIFA